MPSKKTYRIALEQGQDRYGGNYWLAMAQYFIAAEQPHLLAAIAPLEGAVDPFREDSFRGGVPGVKFARSIAEILRGKRGQQDWAAMIESNPTPNDFFVDKPVNFSKIKVPAYIGGGYSTNIHTLGSLRAFAGISHQDKWKVTSHLYFNGSTNRYRLVVHSTQEYYDLYSPQRTEDLVRIFDGYLKSVPTDWSATPPVRLALLAYAKPTIVDIPFPDLPWHSPSAQPMTLHLAPNLTLSPTKLSQSNILAYLAGTPEILSFTYTSPSRAALAGPSTLTGDTSLPSSLTMTPLWPSMLILRNTCDMVQMVDGLHRQALLMEYELK
ncbi:hypothetical protein E8E12_009427 [Didymella heteroderae]|uniref:Uncharacterized protein n=1 Tax=Didymella heteroderae TaxID=1769908 RepID=A0A9P4WT00_9PLEO|nr:hypothetical protein E8E12_009427 [Didymella heteroderae]